MKSYRRIGRQRPAALPVQFPRDLNRGQQRLHSEFGMKRQFEKPGQVSAQSGVAGAEFILQTMVFEPLKFAAVLDGAAQGRFLDAPVQCREPVCRFRIEQDLHR